MFWLIICFFGLGGGGLLGKFGRFLSLLLNKFGGLIGFLFCLFYDRDFKVVVFCIKELFMSFKGFFLWMFLFFILFLNNLGGFMGVCCFKFLVSCFCFFCELDGILELLLKYFFFWIGYEGGDCVFWLNSCGGCGVIVFVFFILELKDNVDLRFLLIKFLKLVGGFKDKFFIMFFVNSLGILFE